MHRKYRVVDGISSKAVIAVSIPKAEGGHEDPLKQRPTLQQPSFRTASAMHIQPSRDCLLNNSPSSHTKLGILADWQREWTADLSHGSPKVMAMPGEHKTTWPGVNISRIKKALPISSVSLSR